MIMGLLLVARAQGDRLEQLVRRPVGHGSRKRAIASNRSWSACGSSGGGIIIIGIDYDFIYLVPAGDQ